MPTLEEQLKGEKMNILNNIIIKSLEIKDTNVYFPKDSKELLLLISQNILKYPNGTADVILIHDTEKDKFIGLDKFGRSVDILIPTPNYEFKWHEYDYNTDGQYIRYNCILKIYEHYNDDIYNIEDIIEGIAPRVNDDIDKRSTKVYEYLNEHNIESFTFDKILA